MSSAVATKKRPGAPKLWTDERIQACLHEVVANWDADDNSQTMFPTYNFFLECGVGNLYMAATRSELGITGYAAKFGRPIGRPGPRRG